MLGAVPALRPPAAARLLAYMPELNVLCGLADTSTQSEQPVTKHLVIDIVKQASAAPA